MATRRNIPVSNLQSDQQSKTLAESQGGPPASSIVSDTRPAVSSDVIAKLLFFTFAMAVVPIGSYFATVNLVFRGNSTYAGGLAAIMANVVLVGYIIVAVREDQDDGKSNVPGVNSLKPQEERKSQ